MAGLVDRALRAMGLARIRPQASRLRPRASYYQGGDVNRLTADWVPYPLSADQRAGWHLQLLRDRARWLVGNSSTAAAVPQLFSENVIGEHGVVLQSRVQTAEGGSVHTAASKSIEAAWYRWCEAKHCTVNRKLSWPELEALITESEVTDGEVLIRLVRGFKNPFGFALDLLDPDQLDHTYNVLPSLGQNEIRRGVEVDEWGGAVAYWLWRNHPSEPKKRERVRVPAEEIIHRYVHRGVRQTRGVTWFAPVLLDVRMLAGGREANLVAWRTAAAKMGFFKRVNEDAAPLTDVENQGSNPPGGPSQPDLTMEAEAGLMTALPDGYDFVPWDPKFPQTNYVDYEKAVLRSIATALRISYMNLSSDLNDTTYGSGRLGLNTEQGVYRKLQRRHAEGVSTPVFQAWLPQALLSGALALPVSGLARYAASAVWHPKPQPWLSPAEDLDVRLREVAAGVNSLTRIANEKGLEFEDILAERKREIERAASLGVPIDLTMKTSKNDMPAPADNATPDDQNPGQPANQPAKKKPQPGAPADDGEDEGDAAPGKAAQLLRVIGGD